MIVDKINETEGGNISNVTLDKRENLNLERRRGK